MKRKTPKANVPEATLDEYFHHWPGIRASQVEGSFEHGFALSISRHIRRPGWKPTVGQWRIMQQLYSQYWTTPEHDIEVIE